MKLLVTGALAFDRIMDFEGYFADRIHPDSLHALSVSFAVETLHEYRGGTAGNVCYTLALLGERPLILARLGFDGETYRQELAQSGVDVSHLDRASDVRTATAMIMTDRANCQITGFYPGAMKYEKCQSLDWCDSRDTLAMISAGNKEAMLGYALACRAHGIPFFVDPGQQWGVFTQEELAVLIQGAEFCMMNEYEYHAIADRLDMQPCDVPKLAKGIVVTRGEHGSTVIVDGEEISIGICRVPRVVDPTGAGDAHRAGFLKGYISGGTPRQMGQVASTAASFCIERIGTQSHRFTADEFQQRYEEHFSEALPDGVYEKK